MKRLKGRVNIKLFDAASGKLTKEVNGTNMLTNALDELYNKIPYQFGHAVVGKNTSLNQLNLSPIAHTALGGILVFPTTLTESASHIYETADSQPVAYASETAKGTGDTDAKRGSFNTNESGNVTGGYKYVYDFATDEGNGTWDTVCLTSNLGGQRYFGDAATCFSLPIATLAFDASFATGYSSSFVGFLNDGRILVATNYQTTAIWATADFRSKFDIPLTEDISAPSLATADHTVTVSNFGNMRYHPMATDGEYLYIFDTATTDTLKVVKIDVDNETQTTYSFTCSGITSFDDGYVAYQVVKNGKVYYQTPTALFICNLSNTADVTKITGTFTNGAIGWVNGIGLYTAAGWIKDGTTTLVGSGITPTDIILTNDGTWGIFVYNTSVASKTLNIRYLTPYLGTIYNLDNTVTKDASKTAKITYTLVEAEES